MAKFSILKVCAPLAALLVFIAVSSQAFPIEWDRCAGVASRNVWGEARTTTNRDDRAYHECRAYYADETAGVTQFRCENVSTKNRYDLFVKGSGATLRVRESREGIWMSSPYAIDIRGRTLKTSGFNRKGILVPQSVCHATH